MSTVRVLLLLLLVALSLAGAACDDSILVIDGFWPNGIEALLIADGQRIVRLGLIEPRCVSGNPVWRAVGWSRSIPRGSPVSWWRADVWNQGERA